MYAKSITHKTLRLHLICLLFLLIADATYSYGQSQQNDFNPLSFVNGSYTDMDDSTHNGLLKFSIYNNQLLYFKSEAGAEVYSLSPAEVKHFTNGKADVYSCQVVDLVGRSGKAKTLEGCFGILLEEGEINAYLIHVNRFGGEPDQYVVLYRNANRSEGVSLPLTFRLKNEQVNHVRGRLIEFFDTNEYLNIQIMQLGTKVSGFINVLKIVQAYNQGNLGTSL